MEEPPVLSRQRMGGVHIWALGKGAEAQSFYTVILTKDEAKNPFRDNVDGGLYLMLMNLNQIFYE